MFKNFWLISLVGLYLVSCSDSSTKITSVEPSEVYHKTTERFTINGENLSANFSVTLAEASCKDVTNEGDNKILATCSAPATGDSAVMKISHFAVDIKNNSQSIALKNIFIKISNAGTNLDLTAAEWACSLDDKNELLWINVVNNDSNFLHYEHRFRYSDATGFGNSADCNNTLDGANCNTHNYFNKLNVDNLCQKDNWRLPSEQEIKLIFNCDNSPSYNQAFFPYKQDNYFLDSSTSAATRADIFSTDDCSVSETLRSTPFYLLGVTKK